MHAEFEKSILHQSLGLSIIKTTIKNITVLLHHMYKLQARLRINSGDKSKLVKFEILNSIQNYFK